jgi:hypothetical protein
MARIARNGGVSPEKRKAILVIFDLLRGEIPSFDGMALRAIGAHLAAVNVSVAISAVFADVREDRFDVALNAFHLFVHAAERILGFGVVEFGDSADRAPSRGSVAIFARDVDGAVGIAGGPFLSGRKRPRDRGVCVRRRHCRGREGKQGPQSELER